MNEEHSIKQTSEQLLAEQQSAAYLAALVNSSEDAIISTSPDRIIRTWNPSAEKMFGYKAHEAKGQHLSIIIPGNLVEEEEGIAARVLKGQHVAHFETYRKRKDGALVYVSLMVSPILDAAGNLTGISKIIRDISLKKQAEDKLAAEAAYFNRRSSEILEILLKFVLKDFSVKAEVTGQGDEMDAIAAGLNTLGEEIGNYIQQLKESDEQIQTIIRNAPDAVVVVDDTGKIVSWNPRAELLFGWKMDEVEGKSLAETILPADPGRQEVLGIEQYLKTRDAHKLNRPLEIIAVNKNGTRFDAGVSISPTVIKGRHYFIGFLRDISFRKRAEAEIKEKNLFLNSILENIPNMIFVKDAEALRFILLNKTGEKMLGMPAQAFVGKNDFDFFPADQAAFFTAKDREVLDKQQMLDIPEEPIETKAGQRWLRTKKIPVIDETGKPVYLVGISEDITEFKEQADRIIGLNTELQKNLEQLQQTNDELESFSYSVSHDLRSPLRAVHGYTQILEEDYGNVLDEGAKRIMAKIMGNAKRMGDLIDDLLAFSRLGRKELLKATLSMQDMVTNLCDDFKHQEPGRDMEFIIGKLPPVSADNVTMKQAWINLIGNAVKYSRPRPKTVIEIGGYEEDDKVVYYIKDNGVGFDMRYSDKLFGVFQRLHGADEFEGTGVGLAIVNRIISRHGGKIWAQSELGKGSAFFFSLNKNNSI